MRARSKGRLAIRVTVILSAMPGKLTRKHGYSTVTITALHPSPDAHTTIIGTDNRGAGWLSLGLIKRGSRKRYRDDITDIQLATAINEAVSGADQVPLLVEA